jgi:glyoxylase-like metal-dependent hydrolase (beta-lactamase superfamily II)
MFDCATLKNRDPDTYSLTRDQVQALDMSDPCFLVVHPQGTLLWETGLNDGVYNRTGGGGARHDIIGQSLKSQLAEIGYKPTDITYLAMSHNHGDHSGNANDYATATWIVQKAEREYMFGVTKPPALNNAEYIALKDSKTIVIEREQDTTCLSRRQDRLPPGSPRTPKPVSEAPKTGLSRPGVGIFPGKHKPAMILIRHGQAVRQTLASRG